MIVKSKIRIALPRKEYPITINACACNCREAIHEDRQLCASKGKGKRTLSGK